MEGLWSHVFNGDKSISLVVCASAPLLTKEPGSAHADGQASPPVWTMTDGSLLQLIVAFCLAPVVVLVVVVVVIVVVAVSE